MRSSRFSLLRYSLVSGVHDLLLEGSWLRETEGDFMGGKLVVAVGDGVKLALNDLLVEWVKEDLLVLLAVKGDSNSFSGDVGWEAL